MNSGSFDLQDWISNNWKTSNILGCWFLLQHARRWVTFRETQQSNIVRKLLSNMNVANFWNFTTDFARLPLNHGQNRHFDFFSKKWKTLSIWKKLRKLHQKTWNDNTFQKWKITNTHLREDSYLWEHFKNEKNYKYSFMRRIAEFKWK